VSAQPSLLNTITDDEFRGIGYTREQALWMNAMEVSIDVVRYRKTKMGLETEGMLDHLKYLELYEPQQYSFAAAYVHDYAKTHIEGKQ
jgi:hypothetical protein